jgi:hypothetical protein
LNTVVVLCRAAWLRVIIAENNAEELKGIMNGIKTLTFGCQFIVVGMFVGLRGNNTNISILDPRSDVGLSLLLIIIGLVISFFGLRKAD